MAKIPIFKLKEQNNKEQKENWNILKLEDLDNVSNWGFERARAHNGSEAGLKVCINIIFETHKEYIKSDIKIQEEAKKPYEIKYLDLLKTNESYRNKIQKLENEDIPKIKEKINSLNQNIIEIKKHPEDYIVTESTKASFYIGIIILSFLTIYLFIFYSSATYSAFFKEFKVTELGVANSIFDPNALSNAYKDGFTELILLLTIPFVFLGLGYLIHKFQLHRSKKKYFKVIFLIFVTFAFDFILAYEITEKIYNIKAENSFVSMPSYSISLAIQNISFWLIIFTGFVVYIIWGFVFDFIMESHSQIDRISSLINSKKAEIENYKNQLAEYEDEINRLNYLIGQNETQATKIKTILDNTTIIKPRDLKQSLNKFLDGWLEWMTANRRKNEEIERAHQIVDNFINNNISYIENILGSDEN